MHNIKTFCSDIIFLCSLTRSRIEILNHFWRIARELVVSFFAITDFSFASVIQKERKCCLLWTKFQGSDNSPWGRNGERSCSRINLYHETLFTANFCNSFVQLILLWLWLSYWLYSGWKVVVGHEAANQIQIYGTTYWKS